MVFGCCTKKRKQSRNLTKSSKSAARSNVQANSFKKTIIKSTTPAKSRGGSASGPRQAQPAKGQQKVNFLKKPSSTKSATAKASAAKGKFEVKDPKATKKQDSSIKKSSSASSKSKKPSSTLKQTSVFEKPPAPAKAPASPKKTPDEKAKAGKSPKRSEREKEKTKTEKGIPPPGSTVDSSLLPFVDKIESTGRANEPTKADPSPHQAPPFVYASIADPRHPQQQLIVSSFVTGGRRVKRWTYADSYPVGQMPPPSLGAMLAARPACSREDCGLTVMEPVGMMQNNVPSVFSKSRQKVKKGGEQIEKKNKKEMSNSAQKNRKSDGPAREPHELSCDASLTYSRTANERTSSSMTNVSEKDVAERRLSEEAVRKKLLESAQLLQQAISKMNEVRYREKDDSLYETSLYKVQKCEKRVDGIARGLSAVDLHESKTNQQKKRKPGY
ncbi:unnamed protein product, partial [Mesorhabditis belari]|uniref:Uncharacterized protein n=1 Tax=Mesorhabditis belari TaxID=2138241 RepID=A0AAF3J416_9BILA